MNEKFSLLTSHRCQKEKKKVIDFDVAVAMVQCSFQRPHSRLIRLPI